MIFQKDHIQMILDKTKRQTRRLVKEGEIAIKDPCCPLGQMIVAVGKEKKLKWVVDKDYSVQNGRGKPGLWVCPVCDRIYNSDTINGKTILCTHIISETSLVEIFSGKMSAPEKACRLVPFRFVITKIRKERLCDITNADAEAEGFVGFKYPKQAYFMIFIKICWKKVPQELKRLGKKKYVEIAEKWNPEVWVLDFEVME